MLHNSKIRLAIIVFLGALGELLSADIAIVPTAQAAESAAALNIPLPSIRLWEHSLNLVTMSPVLADGSRVGTLAVYDDPSTRRAEDYLELYASDGDLVAVAWFDRFGIQRAAVDRALVEGGKELRGDFVVVVDGESL
jgi:hypothetical protein